MVESIKELRKICQSKKQPMYMQHVTMKISIYITKLILYTRASADHVTMSMILLIIAGSVFMAHGTLWTILTGILLMHFTVVLDNVNGEVARYRKEDGIIGTFLEQVYHNIAVHLIFFPLALGVFMATGEVSVLIFGFLCSIFGKAIVLGSVKDAVVAERFDEISRKRPVKLSISGTSVKGGSTESGKMLYSAYDRVRDFWVFPANIIHINAIAVIELLNAHYMWFRSYDLFYLYLAFYAIVSVLAQTASFVANYRGKTAEHYYNALFRKK
jgi:hypothetical protein